MMASFRMYVVLCTVQSVYSLHIEGTMRKNLLEKPSEVIISDWLYVNGREFDQIRDITLDRLVDADTLPTLTVGHFKSLNKLKLMNIALEQVPFFEDIRCSDIYVTGNNITSVPTNAFSEPRPAVLNLSNNKIRSMANRSINMEASGVVLSCNKLRNFSQSWFADPGNVFSLDLEGNQIEFIQDRAFNAMTKLFWLFLGYNHITSIDSNAFPSGIPYLQLQFNNITQLSPHMFEERDVPMQFLNIHHNRLSYLPEALLLKVKPRSISLFGNPWQCQCLRDIERWLRELNTTRDVTRGRLGEAVCVVPVNFKDSCIPLADKELQQTYTRGLSPVPECLASLCKSCKPSEQFIQINLH